MDLTVNYSISTIVILLRFMMDYFGNLSDRTNKNIHHILDIKIYIAKLILFYMTIINNIKFDNNFVLNNEGNKEISQVLIYNNFDYGINMILYIYQKDYESMYHHFVSIAIISGCEIYNYHNATITVMFLFLLSSPFLSVAKVCRALKYNKISEIAFITFGLVFFTCRIVIYTYMLYYTIFNKYYDRYEYYLINSFQILLYKMQIDWMKKIINVIVDNKK